jgi:hypothetical protein
MITKAYVVALPKCDYCEAQAHYDGATTQGPWAFMCDDHFRIYGMGLGTGKGQELIVTSSEDMDSRDRYADAQAALLANDFEAFEDAVGDGDPIDFL